jgi:anionic cell wall polymer biosynthesis LytR-Cps2A-Psr (LCP) family protein
VFKNIETNLNISEVLKMSSSATKIQPDNIQTFKVPGNSVLDGAWYYIMDKDETDKIVKENFR